MDIDPSLSVKNSAEPAGRGLVPGRNARRQLAQYLDEFWGHLFDLHGQLLPAQLDSKLIAAAFGDADATTTAATTGEEEFSEYLPSYGGGVQKESSSSSLLRSIRNMQMLEAYIQGPRPYYNVGSPLLLSNTNECRNLPAVVSGLSNSEEDLYVFEKSTQWEDNSFPFMTSTSDYHQGSIWSNCPYDQDHITAAAAAVGTITRQAPSVADSDSESQQLLHLFRCCIVKLLKLDGSDWLFSQNGGTDEHLIDGVAARERENFGGPALKNDEEANIIANNILESSVPHCGEACVWKVDLIIISFGVWCIHRILVLLLMESRPELWGKYTYVLNRLQGIIEPAFLKPRSPVSPCFCLQLSTSCQLKSSPPVIANVMLPPGWGKCTTGAMVLDLIKDIEIAITCRKGRSGTVAGDLAFPKGKQNLATVLKRYKRRLSDGPIGTKIR